MDDIDIGWRLIQIAHNKMVRETLVREGKSRGARLWGREAVLMFYEIVIAVGEYAEMRGLSAPENHRSRRGIVKRHLPRLAETYNDLYALSVVGRYYKGYATTENAGRKAERCREILARSIPVQ